MEKIDARAFNQIGYGLYVVTTNDGVRDNGMICNTVVQVTATPQRLALTINKETYTHEIIRKTGRLNVNVIDERAEMDLFRCFGFRSGRTADKFAGVPHRSSENGLAVLTQQVNAFFSLEVEQYVDLGTHGLFICRVVEAQVLFDSPTMSYSYYHAHVKPRPAAPAKKRGFVCKICGYVYEGDELPADFICPICKHPASDFEPLA